MRLWKKETDRLIMGKDKGTMSPPGSLDSGKI